MPLDEREQRILEEIERRFYQEDPDLAHAVRNITRSASSRWGARLAVAGLVLGAALMFATFTQSTVVAVIGFVVMVVSATTLAQRIRHRSGRASPEADTSGGGVWLRRLANRLRFRRR